MHLDRTIAALRTLAAQVRGHLDAELFLRSNNGDGIGGVDVPFSEVCGEDLAVVGGEGDDGDVGGTGVRSYDTEVQRDGFAGGVSSGDQVSWVVTG